MDSTILFSFIPEIFLSACILAQLLFNAYIITDLKNNYPIISKEVFSQTVFFLICVILLVVNCKIEGFLSNFIFANDTSTHYLKIFLLLSSSFTIFIIIRSFKLQQLNFFEYFTIFLLSVFSLMLLISSCDMISAYLVIELQALSFYILSSFRRDSAFSTEAGLKYFISGSFISGVFLFGCSILFGCFGTLNLNHLKLIFYFPLDNNLYLLNIFASIGILLIIITFLFKLSVAPFHFWSPDVYDGAPISSTAVFAIVPKFAVIAFLVKWLSVLSNSFSGVSTFLIIVGLLSVFIGTFFAISQKRLKRLFIYSSIAQIGFVIVALSNITVDSLVSVYFCLFVYILTSILLWSNISVFYSFQGKTAAFFNKQLSPLFFSSIANLFSQNKLWALSFVIIFFSVSGIPPLSGFFAKVLILFSLINSSNIITPFILIIVSAISVFYYLKVLKTVFFEPKNTNKKEKSSQIIFFDSAFFFDSLVIALLLFLLLFFFFYPSSILLICQQIVIGSYFF